MEHGTPEDDSVDVVQSCKIATWVGVEDKHVGDTPRFDAPDVAPVVDIGKVAGCRRDSLARREADPMQQCEFEMETPAGHNPIARCRASGKIFRSKLIETGTILRAHRSQRELRGIRNQFS